jgi:hypothetical protein
MVPARLKVPQIEQVTKEMQMLRRKEYREEIK